MMRILLVAVLVTLFLIPPVNASVCSLLPASTLPEPVLLLVAAGNLFGETDEIVAEALGKDWKNGHFQTTEKSLNFGEKRLCSWLQTLPKQEQGQKKRAIHEWMQGYRAVETLLWLLGVEPVATATALTPATRESFPRDDALVRTLGTRAGEDLASAEHPGLWYHLASDLAGASTSDRREIVNDLLARGMEINLKEYETK